MRDPDFEPTEETLKPIERGESLERGDFAYQRVRWGQGLQKFKCFKVYEVCRAAATCVEVDKNGKEQLHSRRKIPFGQLLVPKIEEENPVEKLAKTKNPVVTSLASKLPGKPYPVGPNEGLKNGKPVDFSKSEADEVDSYYEMGHSVVKTVEAEIAALGTEKGLLVGHLATVDKNHRATIEAIERQLEVAKQEHADDRALGENRLKDIDAKIATKKTRVAGIKAMLGST